MVGTKDTSNENSSYLRKIRKPLVEKKRRERMNQSISLLKTLIADTIKNQTTPFTKIDKADILELTVYHLTRTQQQQQSVALATEAASYNNGFKECARATVTYLQNNRSVPENVSNDLSSHLHRTYLSRDQQSNIKQYSYLHYHDRGQGPMNTTGQDVTKTQVNRLSTPLRDERLGLSQGMNIPTFSPILNPNTSLPHLSASFVHSSLEFTPNSSSSSSYLDMSISRDSSTFGSEGESEYYIRDQSDDRTHVSGNDVVAIGSSAEDKVGHVIKETTWRPW